MDEVQMYFSAHGSSPHLLFVLCLAGFSGSLRNLANAHGDNNGWISDVLFLSSPTLRPEQRAVSSSRPWLAITLLQPSGSESS